MDVYVPPPPAAGQSFTLAFTCLRQAYSASWWSVMLIYVNTGADGQQQQAPAAQTSTIATIVPLFKLTKVRWCICIYVFYT